MFYRTYTLKYVTIYFKQIKQIKHVVPIYIKDPKQSKTKKKNPFLKHVNRVLIYFKSLILEFNNALIVSILLTTKTSLTSSSDYQSTP